MVMLEEARVGQAIAVVHGSWLVVRVYTPYVLGYPIRIRNI